MPESADGCCCYLCNECPCSFATLDELQKHLHSAHIASTLFFTASSNPTVAVEDDILDVEMADTGAGKDSEEDPMTIVSAIPEGRCPSNSFFTFGGTNSPTSCSASSSSGGLSISVDVESSASPHPTPSQQNPQMPLGNAHYEISPSSGDYQCQKCPRAFDDRDQLNVHYTHTHRERPRYVCDACGMEFSVKRELSTHSRTHCGEQPHRCEKCGKEFGTKQLLKKHNMWHTGERSHVCAHCGKAFFQKGHLTQHLMIHKGGRPHRCMLCEKTFIFKFDLNRHMKIHAERGHSCPLCAKCFPRSEALDEHLTRCNKKQHARKSSRTSEAGSSPLHSEASSSPLSQQQHQLQNPLFNGVIVHCHSNDGNMTTVKTESPVPLAYNNSPLKTLSDMNNNGLQQYTSNANDMVMERAMIMKALLAQQQHNIQKSGTGAFPALLINHQQHQNQQATMVPCLFCPLKFASQHQMLVHWSISHFRPPVSNANGFENGTVPSGVPTMPANAIADLHRPESNIGNSEKFFRDGIPSSSPLVPPFSDQSPLKLLLKNQMTDLHQHHPGSAIAVEDSATTATTTSSSSCASSPQKASPLGSAPLSAHSPVTLASNALDECKFNVVNSFNIAIEADCPKCAQSREKQAASERALADARVEADRLRAVVQRLGAFAAAGQLFLAGSTPPFQGPVEPSAMENKAFWMC